MLQEVREIWRTTSVQGFEGQEDLYVETEQLWKSVRCRWKKVTDPGRSLVEHRLEMG